jgi:hypothetical protein
MAQPHYAGDAKNTPYHGCTAVHGPGPHMILLLRRQVRTSARSQMGVYLPYHFGTRQPMSESMHRLWQAVEHMLSSNLLFAAITVTLAVCTASGDHAECFGSSNRLMQSPELCRATNHTEPACRFNAHDGCYKSLPETGLILTATLACRSM